MINRINIFVINLVYIHFQQFYIFHLDKIDQHHNFKIIEDLNFLYNGQILLHKYQKKLNNNQNKKKEKDNNKNKKNNKKDQMNYYNQKNKDKLNQKNNNKNKKKN